MADDDDVKPWQRQYGTATSDEDEEQKKPWKKTYTRPAAAATSSTASVDDYLKQPPPTAAAEQPEEPGIVARAWEKTKPWLPGVSQLEDLSQGLGKVGDWFGQKSEELQNKRLEAIARGETPSAWGPTPGEADLAARVAHMGGGLLTPQNAGITAATIAAPEIMGPALMVHGGMTAYDPVKNAIGRIADAPEGKTMEELANVSPEEAEQGFGGLAEMAGGATAFGEIPKQRGGYVQGTVTGRALDKLARGTPFTDAGRLEAAKAQIMGVKPPGMSEVEYAERVNQALPDLQRIMQDNRGKVTDVRSAVKAMSDWVERMEGPIREHLAQLGNDAMVHPDQYYQEISNAIDEAFRRSPGELTQEEIVKAKEKVMNFIGDQSKTLEELEGNRRRLNKDQEDYYTSRPADKRVMDSSDATAMAQKAAANTIRALEYGTDEIDPLTGRPTPGLLEKNGVTAVNSEGQQVGLRDFRKRVGNVIDIRNHFEDAVTKAEQTGDWSAFDSLRKGPSLAAGGIGLLGMHAGGLRALFGLLGGEGLKSWSDYINSRNKNLLTQKLARNLSTVPAPPAIRPNIRTIPREFPQPIGPQNTRVDVNYPQAQYPEPIGPQAAPPFAISGETPPAREAGLWQQPVGGLPAIETGAPSPGRHIEPIGPRPAPVERLAPIQGEQRGLHLPEGPQQQPLFGLEHPYPREAAPAEVPKPPEQLEAIGGAGREGTLGKIGEEEKPGKPAPEKKTSGMEDLKVGDTFVDDKGEPRRILSIEDGKIETADGTKRTYDQNVEHLGDINSPKAQLARGGKFIEAPEEEAKPAEAIAAIQERIKDQTHEGQPRDYALHRPGSLGAKDLTKTTFLLDDGSALQGDKGILSHEQLANEIGMKHLNDANAIRVVMDDSFELHGRPSEAQLAEMSRYLREAGRDRPAYWDFYPEGVGNYSAAALSEEHTTGAGSQSDFRRAIDDYYPETVKQGAGDLTRTDMEDLNVGDTFVDNTGEPRRVTDISKDRIKTADGTERTYHTAVSHLGEINSDRAQLARGGKFIGAFPEEEEKLGEIEKPAPKAAEEKPPADKNVDENGKYLPTANEASTALPSTKKGRTLDPHQQPVHVGINSVYDAPPPTPGKPTYLDNAAKTLDNYPGMKRVLEGITDPRAKVEAAINHFSDNLQWLWHQMPEEIKQYTRKWYDSAHSVSRDLAEDTDKTHQQAAATVAVNSPQRDWDINLSAAKRIMEIERDHQQTRTTPEMLDKMKEFDRTETNTHIKAEIDRLKAAKAKGLTQAVIDKAKDQADRGFREAAFQTLEKATKQDLERTDHTWKDIAKNVEGKRFGELENDGDLAAGWIRAYDEVNNDQTYHRYAPDGTKMDLVRKAPGRGQEVGDPAKFAWSSLSPIRKSLSILRDGSAENISRQLGEQHKVRSFYNNIIDPRNKNPHVTIDTHAVAASHIAPFAQSDAPVEHNFGGGGGSSAVTGARGMYPIYHEAYVRAAKAVGEEFPRMMQSITWEQVRDLFPDTWKNKANKDAVGAIWKDFDDHKLSIDEARQKIVDLAGGFKNDPDWLAHVTREKNP